MKNYHFNGDKTYMPQWSGETDLFKWWCQFEFDFVKIPLIDEIEINVESIKGNFCVYLTCDNINLKNLFEESFWDKIVTHIAWDSEYDAWTSIVPPFGIIDRKGNIRKLKSNYFGIKSKKIQDRQKNFWENLKKIRNNAFQYSDSIKEFGNTKPEDMFKIIAMAYPKVISHDKDIYYFDIKDYPFNAKPIEGGIPYAGLNN